MTPVRRTWRASLSAHPLLVDLAVGLIAGLSATYVTNLAQGPLRHATPATVEWQEKRVRPGASSSLVAARQLATWIGVPATPRAEELFGAAIHIGVGTSWGPIYGILRRFLGLRASVAALSTGLAMSLILDEGLVPALGLSAPNGRYPIFTRLRGILAHLVYGAVAGLAAEGLGRLAGRPPGPADIATTSGTKSRLNPSGFAGDAT